MLCDTQLTGKVLGVWLRTLEAFHRKRAKSLNILSSKNGYVTWPQRFGSALNANIHFHTVTVDGVFALPGPEEEKPTFVQLDAPDAAEIESLLIRLVTRIRRCVEKHQQGKDETFDDALTSTLSASLHARRSDVGLKPDPRRHEAFCEGFSLHCGVRLHENDRAGIERLCRYGARGPLAKGRLQKVGDDKYQYTMKRMVNGRTVLELTGVELLRKLSILIPPPRVHMTRFHGVYAPNARWRPHIVPARARDAASACDVPSEMSTRPKPSASRIDWASLLRRVFKVDVLCCKKCGGRMKVIAVIEEPSAIEKILRHLGLPPVPLSTAPARGQRCFEFGA
jgi:hypothetical protein